MIGSAYRLSFQLFSWYFFHDVSATMEINAQGVVQLETTRGKKLIRSETSDAEIAIHHGQVAPSLLQLQESSLSNAYVNSKLAKQRVLNMPAVAWRAFEALAEEKRQLLEAGSTDGATPKNPDQRGSVFEAVEVSLPLEPPILQHPRTVGFGQGDKNIVGLKQLTRGNRACITYGIGIADDSHFEQRMQDMGCETHAFDCTISPDSPAVVGKKFKFHNWCIGEKQNVNMSKTVYVDDDKKLQFKTLTDTMKELGHTYVDLLKFDIEGFEWKLFETQILKSEVSPEQLSFELHTDKANPYYVPHDNVKDKGFVQVNRLFKSLFDMGYRVTSKELNSGDPACAEFVAIRVQ